MKHIINYTGHPLLAQFVRQYNHLKAATEGTNNRIRQARSEFKDVANTSERHPALRALGDMRALDVWAKYDDRELAVCEAYYELCAAQHELYDALIAFGGVMSAIAVHLGDAIQLNEEIRLLAELPPALSPEPASADVSPAPANELIQPSERTVSAPFEPFQKWAAMQNFVAGLEMYEYALAQYSPILTFQAQAPSSWASYGFGRALNTYRALPKCPAPGQEQVEKPTKSWCSRTVGIDLWRKNFGGDFDPRLTGLLSALMDVICQGLPNEVARAWVAEVGQKIPAVLDSTMIVHHFAAFLLDGHTADGRAIFLHSAGAMDQVDEANRRQVIKSTAEFLRSGTTALWSSWSGMLDNIHQGCATTNEYVAGRENAALAVAESVATAMAALSGASNDPGNQAAHAFRAVADDKAAVAISTAAQWYAEVFYEAGCRHGGISPGREARRAAYSRMARVLLLCIAGTSACHAAVPGQQ